MKNKPHYTLILMLMLIFATPLATSSEGDDGASSSFPLIDEQGTALQGGQGNWDIVTVETLHSYGHDSTNTQSPIVADLTQDGTPEILMQLSDLLSIYNIDENGNRILLTNVDVGNVDTDDGCTDNVYTTPGWYTWNATHTKIVTTSCTSIITYDFNGTTLTQANSTAWTVNEIAGTWYPKIICSNGFGDSNVYCNFEHYYKDTTYRPRIRTINLNTTYINASLDLALLSGVWSQVVSPKVADVDSDGENELLYMVAYLGATPIDINITMCEDPVDGQFTCNELYFHNNAGTAADDFTDFSIVNLDGTLTNGWEVLYGYSDDGTNWYMRALDKNGTVLEADFWNALTAPEGDWASLQPLDYSLSSGSSPCVIAGSTNIAGLLVHDDTGGETILACVSLFAGAATDQISYDDSSEFQSFAKIIGATLTADTVMDMAYSNVIFDGSTEELLVGFNVTGTTYTIPIDLFLTGTLDLLLYNGSRLAFFNDNIINNNVNIEGVAWTSGNPVCNNTKVIFNLEVSDDSNDFHTCTMNITNVNGTSVYNSSSSNGTAPLTHVFEYTFSSASGEDAYTVGFYCRDQYHTAWENHNYNLWTANSPNCFGFNQNGGSDTTTTTEAETLEEEWNDNVDDAAASIGIESSSGKAMFWLLIMMGIGFLLLMNIKNLSFYIFAAVETMLLVLGWVMGFVGTGILVIIGLFSALAITIVIFRGRGE